jgi:hypothetical protein
MNERIKEFARQAGFKVNWQHEDVQAIKMAQYEEFAELIVRECADICDRFQARNVGMQPAECAGAIRRMFGVEE